MKCMWNRQKGVKRGGTGRQRQLLALLPLVLVLAACSSVGVSKTAVAAAMSARPLAAHTSPVARVSTVATEDRTPALTPAQEEAAVKTAYLYGWRILLDAAASGTTSNLSKGFVVGGPLYKRLQTFIQKLARHHQRVKGSVTHHIRSVSIGYSNKFQARIAVLENQIKENTVLIDDKGNVVQRVTDTWIDRETLIQQGGKWLAYDSTVR